MPNSHGGTGNWAIVPLSPVTSCWPAGPMIRRNAAFFLQHVGQFGAAVRRAEHDHSLNAGVIVVTEPGPHDQAAHAVHHKVDSVDPVERLDHAVEVSGRLRDVDPRARVIKRDHHVAGLFERGPHRVIGLRRFGDPVNFDRRLAGHRRQLVLDFHLFELVAARFQRAVGVAIVLGIEQTKVFGKDVLLNPPAAEEFHVAPELPSAERLHRSFPRRVFGLL